MTSSAGKAVSLIARISDALGLRQPPVELSGRITPVFNVHDLICELGMEISTVGDPGATGTATLFTVPAGEYWMPWGLDVHRATGTTITIQNLYVADDTNGMRLLATAAGSTELIYQFPADHNLLGPGWRVRVSVDAYSAGETLYAALWTGKHRLLTPPSVQT